MMLFISNSDKLEEEMEFRHFEAFVAVADTGSFTLASERINLSQSAVSQLIKRLEDEVGEALFVRNTRQLEITERGRNLLPTAHELLSLRRGVLETTPDDPHLVRGQLRVGTSSSATAFLWSRMYRAFAKSFPQIDLDIRTTSHTDRTREDLLSGRLDIGFLPFPHYEPRLESVELGCHRALLVASPEHRLSRMAKVEVVEIIHEPFILYEKGINFRRLSDYFFRVNKITPAVAARSNDTYLIRTLAEIGFGLAFLPDWSIERELTDARLVEINLDTGNLNERLGLAFLKNGISRPARIFKDFCLANRDLIPSVARRKLPTAWCHHMEEAEM
jgi:DNA-binding transcriptional LysR family regulator